MRSLFPLSNTFCWPGNGSTALIGARIELRLVGGVGGGAFVAAEVNGVGVLSIAVGATAADWMQFVDPQVSSHVVNDHRSKMSAGSPVICDAVEVKTRNGFAF